MNMIDLSISQAFSPLGQLLAQHYHMDVSADEELLMSLSIVYYVTELILLIPWMYLLQHQGLRFCIVFCVLIQVVAAWVRYLAFDMSFSVLLLGQGLASIGSPVLHFSNTKLAIAWFGETERGKVIALNQFCLFILLALNPLLLPHFVNTEALLQQFILLQAIIMTIVSIASLLWFRGYPPVPPSLSAIAKNEISFWFCFYESFTNCSFMLLATGGGILFGFFSSFELLLPQLSVVDEFDNELVEEWLTAIVIGSMFGTVIGGIILDKLHPYKLLTVVGSCVFIPLSLLIIWFHPHENALFIFPLLLLIGFLTFLSLPAVYEGGSNMTFPIEEEFSASIIIMIRDLIVCSLTYSLLELVKAVSRSNPIVIIFAGLTTITFFLFMAVKKDYRRTAYEEQMKKMRPRVTPSRYASNLSYNSSMSSSDMWSSSDSRY